MTRLCQFCHDSPDIPVSRAWSFVIPRVWPNPQNVDGKGNRLANQGKGKLHAIYKHVRTAWVSDLLIMRQVNRVEPARLKRRVCLTRLISLSGQLYDDDNLVAGAKPIRDALIHSGWIKDDSSVWLKAHYDQERSQEYGVRFLIEEFEVPEQLTMPVNGNRVDD